MALSPAPPKARGDTTVSTARDSRPTTSGFHDRRVRRAIPMPSPGKEVILATRRRLPPGSSRCWADPAPAWGSGRSCRAGRRGDRRHRHDPRDPSGRNRVTDRFLHLMERDPTGRLAAIPLNFSSESSRVRTTHDHPAPSRDVAARRGAARDRLSRSLPGRGRRLRPACRPVVGIGRASAGSPRRRGRDGGIRAGPALAEAPLLRAAMLGGPAQRVADALRGRPDPAPRVGEPDYQPDPPAAAGLRRPGG
jgi:hypothetical protein